MKIEETLQPKVVVSSLSIARRLKLRLEEVRAGGVECSRGKRHKRQEQRDEVHRGRLFGECVAMFVED